MERDILALELAKRETKLKKQAEAVIIAENTTKRDKLP
jgi:hypothetical protein